MTLQFGDVVQIDHPDTKDELGLINRGNPFHGCFGIVAKADGEGEDHVVLVYIPLGYLRNPVTKDRTPFLMPFALQELVEIGAAKVIPDDLLKHVEALEKQQRAVRNDPEVQLIFEGVERRKKYKHLAPGSAEAKSQGCSCEDVRDDTCVLHAMSLSEIDKLKQKIDNAFEDGEADPTA